MDDLPEWVRDAALDGGTLHGIRWCVAHGPFQIVNGYAQVPEGHPWAGLGMFDLPSVPVHGGITLVRDGWIGFDTMHAGDVWPLMPDVLKELAGPYAREWPFEAVVAETHRLTEAVAAAWLLESANLGER